MDRPTNRRAEARRATRIIKGVVGAAAAEIERFNQELRELADAGRIAHDAALRANREAAFELWQAAHDSDDRTLAFVISCAGRFGSSLAALQREFLSLADEHESDLTKLRDFLRIETAAEEERQAQRLMRRLTDALGGMTANQAQRVRQIVGEEMARRA